MSLCFPIQALPHPARSCACVATSLADSLRAGIDSVEPDLAHPCQVAGCVDVGPAWLCIATRPLKEGG